MKKTQAKTCLCLHAIQIYMNFCLHYTFSVYPNLASQDTRYESCFNGKVI